jgi:hypothetical protein
MESNIYVFNGHGYSSANTLSALAHTTPEKAYKVRRLDLMPKLIFRVKGRNWTKLVTDPVEVHRLTRSHDDAHVDVLKMVA